MVKHRRTARVLGGWLLVVVAAAGCGDGANPFDAGTGTIATTATTVTAATTAPTPTTATTTTIAATTHAPASTTTTSPSTTTSTSTSTTTTTTQPPQPMLFRPDGLGIVWFGEDPAVAIAAVQAHLGFAPTADTGWVGNLVYGVCPGTTYRRVSFGGLDLEFADAGFFGAGGSAPQLFTYRYNGTPAGITPGPPQTADVGMTVADLQAMYPGVTIYPADEFFGPTFRVTAATQYEQLWGTLTGTTGSDTVTSITGGIGCGE